MSAYTSIKISRGRALEIVARAMSRRDDLQDMVDLLLRKHTLYNVREIVDNDEENDDERLDPVAP